MELILDISQDRSIRDQLRFALNSCCSNVEFHHADSTREALDQIDKYDMDIILVDVRVLPEIRQEINEILGSTSLTTKIVLLEPTDELVDLEAYSGLGLESLSLPLSAAELRNVIGH